MSSTLSNSSSINTSSTTSSFHELKKQASFYLKEKIKTARLALTDVTPAQLLTEEAISGNPDAVTLASISKAAFDLDDYSRILEILHNRLLKFERKWWRVSYNSLIILDHLLTHGPESVALEFQSEKHVLTQMGSFQFIDENGFNWGLVVRNKSERILNLLEEGPALKRERERARKLTREIQGFGTFCRRSSSSSSHVILPRESSSSSSGAYGICTSQHNGDHDDNRDEDEDNDQVLSEKELRLKDNVIPNKELLICKGTDEFNTLLGSEKDGSGTRDSIENSKDHPFYKSETQASTSLLSG